MKITKNDLIADIANFPIEVVEKMIERQIEAGNTPNVKVFQKWRISGKVNGGFDWKNTPEGQEFWHIVIGNKIFEVFSKNIQKILIRVFMFIKMELFPVIAFLHH